MKTLSNISLLIITSLGITIPNSISSVLALSITDTGQNPITIEGGEQLSGITYVTDNLFYTVSDSVNAFFPTDIDVDLTSGQINFGVVGESISISGSDHEGIAYNPNNNSVFISLESDSSIREYAISDGTELSTVNVPEVFQNIRDNLGLESLTRQENSLSLWTANEEALTIDGERGTVNGNQTLVRLQRFDSTFNPESQWAYPVDIPDPSLTIANGVSDLLVLPNGQLLVLEREASQGIPGFQNRIYAVDFAGATDISGLTLGLSGETFTPVSKNLLWTDNFLLNNFEGLTLGPQLDNGDYSLILISDDGSGFNNSLLGLTISGVDDSHRIPEPTSIIASVGVAMTLLGKGRWGKK